MKSFHRFSIVGAIICMFRGHVYAPWYTGIQEARGSQLTKTKFTSVAVAPLSPQK
jgi:hypothetical protein